MIRVGVVRGGISNEYDVSLQSGATILELLRTHHADKYEAVDVLITKDGIWHIAGRSVTAEELKNKVDVIWNALHGAYGEDGQIQSMLEELGIPYTGSGPVASAISINKRLTKEHVRTFGIKTAQEYMIDDYRNHPVVPEKAYFKEQAQNVFLKFSPPWVVKPIGSGSSVGVSIARTRGELVDAIRSASEMPGEIMVEEFIKGKEATVAVTEEFRGEPVYSFLPIEIRVPAGKFFDYEYKYNGQAQEISPGNFARDEKEQLQKIAQQVHAELGLKHYSRSDFIVSSRGIYFLEVNTLPGLTKESLYPKALAPLGTTMPDFIDHIIQLALK
jgi:D-alanine-D-alanine ligase